MDNPQLIRRIEWRPAFHRCSTDRGKDYGIGCVRMTWVLSDEHRAITWEASTDWGMPDEDFKAANPTCTHHMHQDGYPSRGHGSGSFVAFHFDKPTSVDQDGTPCNWLGDRTCYGDIGFTMADEPWRLLCVEGEEAVWAWLETTLNEYELDVTVGADAG